METSDWKPPPDNGSPYRNNSTGAQRQQHHRYALLSRLLTPPHRIQPDDYPDLHLIYTVQVESKGKHIEVTVDLDRPIPQEFIGKVGFNLEFFPGSLFGKPWIMDGQSGIFPQQPNSP